MYRPEGWNPVEISKRVFSEDTTAICDTYRLLIEAGADAMLRALIKEGFSWPLSAKDGQKITVEELFPNVKVGHIVFIPDD